MQPSTHAAAGTARRTCRAAWSAGGVVGRRGGPQLLDHSAGHPPRPFPAILCGGNAPYVDDKSGKNVAILEIRHQLLELHRGAFQLQQPRRDRQGRAKPGRPPVIDAEAPHHEHHPVGGRVGGERVFLADSDAA